eukprot:1151886-Pelagomonas_calceolata.AAC.4
MPGAPGGLFMESQKNKRKAGGDWRVASSTWLQVCAHIVQNGHGACAQASPDQAPAYWIPNWVGVDGSVSKSLPALTPQNQAPTDPATGVDMQKALVRSHDC